MNEAKGNRRSVGASFRGTFAGLFAKGTGFTSLRRSRDWRHACDDTFLRHENEAFSVNVAKVLMPEVE